MVDDVIDPKDLEDIEDEDIDDDLGDDPLLPGKKKPKKLTDDDASLDDLADEEEDVLPEDAYDDLDLF
jgi:hypothetical protein